MVWIYLFIAIAFEVAGTLLLKYSHGFEKVGYGMAAIACYSVCFWFFAPVLKVLPAGVAYAIWAGVGIAAVTALGIILFEQKLSLIQIACIAMITIGAIGLHSATPPSHDSKTDTHGQSTHEV